MICTFLTNDRLHKYISKKGNNLTPYSIAVGYESVFLTPHIKFVKRELINDDELLNTNETSLDPFDYHVSNSGEDSFEELQIYKIHSNYD